MPGFDRRKLQGGAGRRARIGAALVFALVVAGGGCGDGQDAPTPEASTPAITGGSGGSGDDGPREGDPAGPDAEPATPDKGSGPAESGAGDPRRTVLEREAIRAVRAFVAALDAGDGARACARLAPGVAGELELPVSRGGCPASLGASIGYRDARGLPVWEGGEIAGVRSVELGDAGASARVVATVITRFADREQPSVEDDVVHLVRRGGEWLIAKPSATLLRAIGVADLPPSVLAPPR